MRVYQTTDEAAVRRLYGHLFDIKDYEGADRGNLFWLASNATAVAAFASARPSVNEPDAFFLSRCGVLTKYRGQGLQRRLIHARLRWAKAHGIRRAITYTLLENVASARNLVRAGFLPYWPKTEWAGKVWYFEKVLA